MVRKEMNDKEPKDIMQEFVAAIQEEEERFKKEMARIERQERVTMIIILIITILFLFWDIIPHVKGNIFSFCL